MPSPAGEEIFSFQKAVHFRRWVFFLLPVIGGLASGVLVRWLAPEAGGEGTDAAIDAFHNKRGMVRSRVPFVKALTSIIVLATGGSVGREGPIAQIGGGFGSIVANFFRLSDRERRILLLAGIGGGLSAIFRAPLGGALIAIEILYKEDLETDALIPTVVSSIISYIIFTSIFGYQPILSFSQYSFHDPRELIFYAGLALVSVPLGILYIKCYYLVRDKIFKPLNLPTYIKPMLGGVLVGLIGLAFPQVYSGGWGWIQQAMSGNLAIWLMASLIFAKIIATSISLGSGASGGIFGPTIYIGAMIGGVVGFLGNKYFPDIVQQPDAFVVVGMGAFLAGVANAPIGALLMCSEMTKGYGLIAPLMLVSTIAILFTRRYGIFEYQVQNRFHSPAHIGDFTINVLAEMKVKDVFKPKALIPIPRTLPYAEIKRLFAESTEECFPVVDEQGRLVGVISWEQARPIAFQTGMERLLIAQDLMVPAVTVTPENSLYEALVKFLESNLEELMVVSSENPNQVLGVIRHEDLIYAYNQEILRRKSQG